MAEKRERVGGHVGRKRAAKALGFEPEVGETFEVAGLRLRVLSRTIGLEDGDDGEESWFDVFFVATVEPVDDIEGTAAHLREIFGLEAEVTLEDAEEDDEDAKDGEGDAVADADESTEDEAEADAAAEPAETIPFLDEAVMRDIEDILKAA